MLSGLGKDCDALLVRERLWVLLSGLGRDLFALLVRESLVCCSPC